MKKTNISKMALDLLGSDQQFGSNQTRGVGTKCVGTKQLRRYIIFKDNLEGNY